MKSQSTALYGHDSEVFATIPDADGNQVPLPLVGRIGGTKEEPIPVLKGFIHEDGVSGEMSILPVDNVEDFVNNTFELLDTLEEKILSLGGNMLIAPSVEFPLDHLMMLGEQAMTSGCDPDYNASTMDYNHYPDLSENGWRHGSGHIHFDAPPDKPDTVIQIVKWLDVLLKVPQWFVEGDVPRNQHQGGLGNFRIKPYGGEYRSSSNIILQSEANLRHAFHACTEARRRVSYNEEVSDGSYNLIKKIIGKGAKASANDKTTLRHLVMDMGAVMLPTQLL